MISHMISVLTNGKGVLGPKTPLSFRQVVLIIYKSKAIEYDARNRTDPILKQIKTVCLQTQSWEEIATIIEAITAYLGNHSFIWLNLLSQIISANRDKKDEQLLTANPRLILGLSLGLFRSINWLDENSQEPTLFNERLPTEIIELICWNDSIVKKANLLLPNQAFESRLSQAIKAYSRAEPILTVGLPRMVDLRNIINGVLTKINNSTALPRINSLILDQFSYAVFYWINPAAKIKSIKKSLAKSPYINASMQSLLESLSGIDEADDADSYEFFGQLSTYNRARASMELYEESLAELLVLAGGRLFQSGTWKIA